MGYNTFEELDVYKSSRKFRIRIYKLVKELPIEEKYNLAGQMRRAALSLTNNIAEGHGRFFYQEYIQFCRISRGSLMELIDDLNTCIDENYMDKSYIEKLKAEGYKINRMLNGYIAYIKKKNRRSRQIQIATKYNNKIVIQ